MIQKLKYIFRESNFLLFISIAFVFQFMLLLALKSVDAPDSLSLYQLKGDGKQYISYCENFYRYGSYFEGTPQAIFSYTNRMPGMCVLYVPLRFLFCQQTTLNIIVVLQVLLSSIASYVLAKTAKKIIKKDWAFYLAFLLYGTGMYCANYNHRLYTESQALSTLIFAFYFFISFLEQKKKYQILLFSLFITWCVFLRPFIAPFVGISGLYLFYLLLKKQINTVSFILYIAPIFLVFGSWTIRNYIKTKSFVPLQSGWYEGEKAIHSQYMFIRSFGLEWQWWNQNSEHSWFMTDECLKGFKINRPNDSVFFKSPLNKYMFTGGLTIDSLKKARYNCWQSTNISYSETERDSFAKQSTRIFNKFIDNQKQHYPFYYYIIYPGRVLLKLIVQFHGASLVSLKYPINVLLIFIDAIYNVFILLFGYLSIVFLLLNYKNWNVFFLSITAIPLFIALYFSFYLRVYENRYIVLAFPFLIIGALYGINYILKFRYRIFMLLILSIILFSSGIYSVVTDIRW